MDAYETGHRRHLQRARPLVRDPGRQEVVHADGGRGAVVDTLEGLDLHFPKVSEEKRKELQAARKLLEAEGSAS